jgi:hypothetical protein
MKSQLADMWLDQKKILIAKAEEHGAKVICCTVDFSVRMTRKLLGHVIGDFIDTLSFDKLQENVFL